MSAAPRDGAGSVEFFDALAGDRDGTAETPDELPAPDSVLRPWHAAAAVAVVVALAAVAVTESRPAPSRPQPPGPGPGPRIVEVARPTAPLTGDLFGCLARHDCTAVSEESAAVARAVTGRLRDTLISSEVVIINSSGRLRARQVNGIAGDVLVAVRVLTAPDAAVPAQPAALDLTMGQYRVGYVRTGVLGGFQVQVQAKGPMDWVPPLAVLQALAADARLLAAPAPLAGPEATLWG